MLHEEVNRNGKLILGDSVTQLPNRILEDIAWTKVWYCEKLDIWIKENLNYILW